jgi:hypothetical protein
MACLAAMGRLLVLTLYKQSEILYSKASIHYKLL